MTAGKQMSLIFKKDNKGGSRELQTTTHHPDPWEGNRTADPGYHFQEQEVQENHQ